jgi:uncharacterized protein YdhG (YjbR/CyaY superfamily)
LPGKFKTIDDYIAALPVSSQAVARDLQRTIKSALPDAVERVKYDMPAFQVDGISVIYFAIWKKHVGLYPIYRGTPELEAELVPYRTKKDTVQFDLNQPLPHKLIAWIAASQLDRLNRL